MKSYRRKIWKTEFLFGMASAILFTAISYWINKNTLPAALASGLTGALLIVMLNRFLFHKYGAAKYVLDAISLELCHNESITFESPANYVEGETASGGKLFLTNHRLVFVAHSRQVNVFELVINLDEITKTQKKKFNLLVGPYLTVKTLDGGAYDFVIESLSKWLEFLSDVERNNAHIEYSATA